MDIDMTHDAPVHVEGEVGEAEDAPEETCGTVGRLEGALVGSAAA